MYTFEFMCNELDTIDSIHTTCGGTEVIFTATFHNIEASNTCRVCGPINGTYRLAVNEYAVELPPHLCLAASETMNVHHAMHLIISAMYTQVVINRG